MLNTELSKVLILNRAAAIPNLPCLQFLSTRADLGQPMLCAKSRPEHHFFPTVILIFYLSHPYHNLKHFHHNLLGTALACKNLITSRISDFDHFLLKVVVFHPPPFINKFNSGAVT